LLINSKQLIASYSQFKKYQRDFCSIVSSSLISRVKSIRLTSVPDTKSAHGSR